MRNAKNREIGTSTRVSDTKSWRSQELRLFITGVPKCRNVKLRKVLTTKVHFGDRDMERQDNSSPQECQNAEMMNCEMVK
jgi:hypothetical protein